MFKIVRFTCAGLDVHKDLIVATIGITDKKTSVTEYYQRNFKTINYDLHNLLNWLISYNCFEVCMESTGKYWIPVFNVLEENENMKPILVQPKYVKAIKGKKLIKKIQNGFVIFLNIISLKVLLFHQKISARLENFADIVTNLLVCVLLKETDIKIL